MTENEQFELIELEKLGLCIQDNDTGILYYMNDRISFAGLCALLNEQDKAIKELTNELELYRYHVEIVPIGEEND